MVRLLLKGLYLLSDLIFSKINKFPLLKLVDMIVFNKKIFKQSDPYAGKYSL